MAITNSNRLDSLNKVERVNFVGDVRTAAKESGDWMEKICEDNGIDYMDYKSIESNVRSLINSRTAPTALKDAAKLVLKIRVPRKPRDVETEDIDVSALKYGAGAA